MKWRDKKKKEGGGIRKSEYIPVVRRRRGERGTLVSVEHLRVTDPDTFIFISVKEKGK